MFTPKMEKEETSYYQKIKKTFNHSQGFTIPEAMIACALGVCVVLLIAKFMQNSPNQQVEKARERLEVAASSFNTIERLVSQINNSQILKTELIECRSQNLSPKRTNAVTTTTITLDSPSDQSFNLTTSVHSELVMANTKPYEVTTVSPESFQVGDIVALTQKDNSAIGAVYVVKKIANNILTLDRSLNVPSQIGCNINNSVVSDFSSLVTESGIKLDKLEFISYRVEQSSLKSDKLDLVFFEFYNTQRPLQNHVALNNILKLKITDTWTPFTKGEEGKILGRMNAEIDIDYEEEGQTGAQIKKNLKSYAGYRYTASTRVNFAIEVDAKPVDVVSSSCMVIAKQDTPAIKLPEDPDNYYKFINLSAYLSDDDDLTGPIISAQVYAGANALECYKSGKNFSTNKDYIIELKSDNQQSITSNGLIFGYNVTTKKFDEFVCVIPNYNPNKSYSINIKTAQVQFFDPNTSTTTRNDCSVASILVEKMPPEGSFYIEDEFKCRQRPGEIYSYAKLAYNNSLGNKKYGPSLYPLCLWEGETEYSRNCDKDTTGQKKLLKIKAAPFNLLPSPIIVNCTN